MQLYTVNSITFPSAPYLLECNIVTPCQRVKYYFNIFHQCQLYYVFNPPTVLLNFLRACYVQKYMVGQNNVGKVVIGYSVFFVMIFFIR